jgi:protein-S-isoprenylcysteine O-methyltransferase Ste14
VGFWTKALWPLLLLPFVLLVMQIAVVAREEVYLERVFGQEYRDYKRSVRRRL